MSDQPRILVGERHEVYLGRFPDGIRDFPVRPAARLDPHPESDFAPWVRRGMLVFSIATLVLATVVVAIQLWRFVHAGS